LQVQNKKPSKSYPPNPIKITHRRNQVRAEATANAWSTNPDCNFGNSGGNKEDSNNVEQSSRVEQNQSGQSENK
jgi:hypothetical protein